MFNNNESLPYLEFRLSQGVQKETGDKREESAVV
jgi:hypothetical protein